MNNDPVRSAHEPVDPPVWAEHTQRIELPTEALAMMHDLAESPPAPSGQLRERARRYGMRE